MTKSAARWLEVCAVQDIPSRGAIRVNFADRTIAIFRTFDNNIRALEDRCPHKGGALSAGIVHGNCVTCPLHNWVISLDSGEALGEDEGQVDKYNIQVKDDKVFLEAPNSMALSVA